MILALAATMAIVVLDHASLRAEPRSSAAELTALWQGDVLEVRGARAGYLKVYDYHRERGGYLRSDAVSSIEPTEAGAAELLTVLRFLRETPGSEALGISYGAAYLKAVPARALTAEPFDAIARMAERLADRMSAGSNHASDSAARLDVVQQFGIHMRTFEHNGRMRLCYDGELFRRVLATPGATFEQRANAALGLTRGDCIDPDLGPTQRASLDDECRKLLDQIEERNVEATTQSRLHARRAALSASLAFRQSRRGESSNAAAARALAELLAVHMDDLGEDRRSEYLDAVLRVSAIRWGLTRAQTPSSSPLMLKAEPGDPGQTCITLEDARRHDAGLLVRRCTYGIVWLASAQVIPQGPALVLSVQPLESWRELWVFHEQSGRWTIDVLSPGTDEPEEGVVEFAGFAPGPRRVLIAREVKEHGRFHRWFEERRLDDLALVRQASSPDMLRDFNRWQDGAWRRNTLALH